MWGYKRFVLSISVVLLFCLLTILIFTLADRYGTNDRGMPIYNDARIPWPYATRVQWLRGILVSIHKGLSLCADPASWKWIRGCGQTVNRAAPDSIYRLFVCFKRLEESKELVPPTLVRFERQGFSVLEWGGSVLGPHNVLFSWCLVQ